MLQRKNMSIAVVGYHGYPSEAVGARRISELACHLAGEGHTCTQFSAAATANAQDERLGAACASTVYVPDRNLSPFFSHSDRRWTAHSSRGWRRLLARVPGLKPAYLRVVSTFRTIDDKKGWSGHLFLRLVREHRRRPFDVVLASGPPFSPLLATALFCRSSGVPLVADFRDPWAIRGASVPGGSDIPERGLMRRLQDFVCRTATVLTTATESLQGLLQRGRYAAPVVAIPNGFDEWMVRADEPIMGELRILHAGSIYYNRNPRNFLRGAAAFLQEVPEARGRMMITLLGHIDHDKRVEVEAELGSDAILRDHVRILDRVAPEEVSRLIEESNVLLTLAQRQFDLVPAKVFEHVASRRPMLIVTEPGSATDRIVRGYPRAMSVADDAGAVRRGLDSLYRQLVSKDAALPELQNEDSAPFSRARTNALFAAVLEDAISQAATTAG